MNTIVIPNKLIENPNIVTCWANNVKIVDNESLFINKTIINIKRTNKITTEPFEFSFLFFRANTISSPLALIMYSLFQLKKFFNSKNLFK